MVCILVEIVRYADDSQPGWVECHLNDAHGRLWSFVEKVPMVTEADLNASSTYPQPGIIACEVIERRQDGGREVVIVNTNLPWSIEATTGETRFEIGTEQLIEFDRA